MHTGPPGAWNGLPNARNFLGWKPGITCHNPEFFLILRVLLQMSTDFCDKREQILSEVAFYDVLVQVSKFETDFYYSP